MAPDALIIRHQSAGVPHQLAERLAISVINAGDGAHEHPTQALLDAFTIRQRKGRIAGLKVVIVGDILHSRVARSNTYLLTKLGARVFVTGPLTLIPPAYERLVEEGLTVTPRLEEALEGADVVMALRIQRERQQECFFPSLKEYAVRFGLTRERPRLASDDVLILPPAPVNRGVEIPPKAGWRPLPALHRTQFGRCLAALDMTLTGICHRKPPQTAWQSPPTPGGSPYLPCTVHSAGDVSLRST